MPRIELTPLEIPVCESAAENRPLTKKAFAKPIQMAITGTYDR